MPLAPGRRPPLRLGHRVALPWSGRAAVVCCAVALAIIAVAVLALGTGDYHIRVLDVVRTLLGQGTQASDLIVNTLRLPRVLDALLTGAALGLAGVVFQSLARNPLGSPDIIGFTSGSASGALVTIFVLGAGGAMVSPGAVAGGILTALVVYGLAFKQGAQGYRVVLVGIGISAMLVSLNSYLITRAGNNQAMSAAVWLTGSLNGRGWSDVIPAAIALVVLIPATLAGGRNLRMLDLGDDTAKALGTPVERTRMMLLLLSVGLTAVVTAAAGPVPFVALAAPQVVRRLTRATGPNLGPAVLMGAFLMLMSDFAAQRLFGDTELPVGVMTGAVGGLYLGWLLLHEWRTGRA